MSPAVVLGESAHAGEAGMKFTYASGDRPLEGYTLKHGIGRGGFGEVYHAVSDGGKEVALKLVQRHLNVELRGVGQCLNLKHPNLVSLYDVRQAENGDRWVVMEYMAGESLDQVIARHPQGMPIEEALHWLRGICEGVGYLHERGIVHRDLKPGNIFIEHGTVKIGDYGLSKFISASRRSGQTESIGTVHYMAPEVANGRYGKEIDLYAIGIIFYEMLTGRVPFDGESPGEILMKHLTAQPDLSLLPEEFRSVIGRLLEKDPQRRYPSAAALLADVPSLAGSSSLARMAGWQAAVGGANESQVVTVIPAEPARPAARADYQHSKSEAYARRPAEGFWAAFARRDPIVGLFRQMLPVAAIVVLLVILFVPPLFGLALLYVAVALVIHWWRWNKAGLAAFAAVVGRLIIAGFIGAGVGLLTGGISLHFWKANPEEGPLFYFLGSGFLAGSLAFYLLCWSSDGLPGWWRGLVALLVSPGVGLLVTGLIFSGGDYAGKSRAYEEASRGYYGARYATDSEGKNLQKLKQETLRQTSQEKRGLEDRALFTGLGSGFLTCGAAATLIFFVGWRSRRQSLRMRPLPGVPAPAITDTRIGQTQSWHRSGLSTRGQLMHSMQSHRFLWFSCIFLTGVIFVLVAYPLYLKWHESKHSSDYIYPDPMSFMNWFGVGVFMTLLISVTLIAWASVWRTLRPHRPEIQIPEPTPQDAGR